MDKIARGRARRTGVIRDARGRAVRPIDPYELNLLRRHDVVPEHELRAIAARVGFGLPRRQRVGYLTCVGLFLAGVVFLVIWKLARGTGIDAVEKVLWPVNLLAFVLGAAAFWGRGRKARAGLVRRVMLEHARCPGCGYDIAGLPTEPVDDVTVCPECGCAWEPAGSPPHPTP